MKHENELDYPILSKHRFCIEDDFKKCRELILHLEKWDIGNNIDEEKIKILCKFIMYQEIFMDLLVALEWDILEISEFVNRLRNVRRNNET